MKFQLGEYSLICCCCCCCCFSLHIIKPISVGISRRPVNMQALSPVHSVTLLSSTIVDNNLDEVFDQTWALTHNLSRQIYLTTDCATRTDLSHCISYVQNILSVYRETLSYSNCLTFAGHTTDIWFVWHCRGN